MKRLRELRNQAFFPRASRVFPVTLALEVDTVLPVNEKIVYCSKRKKKRFCDHCDRLVSMLTSEGRPLMMQILVLSKCDFEWLIVFVWSAFQTLLVDVLFLSYSGTTS